MFGEIFNAASSIVRTSVNLVTSTVDVAASLTASTLEEFGNVLDALTGEEREQAVVILKKYDRQTITRKEAARQLKKILDE